jgi:cellulase/cellobiase CelA1
VGYVKASEWAGGFNANVTINNTGTTTLTSWTVVWTFPGDQHLSSAWNATSTQTGAVMTSTNMSYNGTIAPGGNASFGFQGTWTSNDTAPTSFTVNGVHCS